MRKFNPYLLLWLPENTKETRFGFKQLVEKGRTGSGSNRSRTYLALSTLAAGTKQGRLLTDLWVPRVLFVWIISEIQIKGPIMIPELILQTQSAFEIWKHYPGN